MIKSLWKSHWYTVRVLKKSDDQNFLDSLSVTVDGEIVTPEQMKKKIATPLAERRKHMQKAKREANALKNKQDIKRNDKLFERSTIFENNSSSSKEPENNKESPLISTIGKNLSKNAATKEATNSSSKKDSTLTQSPIPINDTGAGSSDVELSRVTNNSPVLKPKDRIFSDRKLSKYSSQKSIIVQPKQINRTIIFSSKGESSVGESSEGELSKEESDDSEEEIQVQQNKTKIDHRSSSKKDKSPKDDETHLNDEDGKNNAFTCICKQFPNVTQEDILRVSEFLQFLKFCNFLQNEIDIPGCQRSRIVDKKKRLIANDVQNITTKKYAGVDLLFKFFKQYYEVKLVCQLLLVGSLLEANTMIYGRKWYCRTGTAIAIAAGRRQCRNHLFNLNQHSHETLAKLRQAVELEVSSNTDGGLPERQAMLALPIIEKVEGILQDVLPSKYRYNHSNYKTRNIKDSPPSSY
uniref:DDT domain-containing protein n=1 Tax=Trichogramma kaykai TaxID=54128 RepID=A0ABD2XRY8_9HYME